MYYANIREVSFNVVPEGESQSQTPALYSSDSFPFETLKEANEFLKKKFEEYEVEESAYVKVEGDINCGFASIEYRFARPGKEWHKQLMCRVFFNIATIPPFGID